MIIQSMISTRGDKGQVRILHGATNFISFRLWDSYKKISSSTHAEIHSYIIRRHSMMERNQQTILQMALPISVQISRTRKIRRINCNTDSNGTTLPVMMAFKKRYCLCWGLYRYFFVLCLANKCCDNHTYRLLFFRKRKSRRLRQPERNECRIELIL